jgi:hypothetical protein
MSETHFSAQEASLFLQEQGFRMSVNTLAKLRCEGGGPAFVYFGRYPRYPRSSLDTWMTSRKSSLMSSTSDWSLKAKVA